MTIKNLFTKLNSNNKSDKQFGVIKSKNKDDFDKIIADDSYGIFPAPTDAQQAINILCDYLLGEDYYIVDPLPNCQANTIIVQQILFKYSPEYRKRFRKLKREYNKKRRINQ